MTVTELKKRVLVKLGVISPEDDPYYTDAETVGARYASLLELLLGEGLVNWTEDDDVPLWAEEPIVSMLAAVTAQDFGIPNPRLAQIQIEGAFGASPQSFAERQLRRQVSREFVYTPAKTTYY